MIFRHKAVIVVNMKATVNLERKVQAFVEKHHMLSPGDRVIAGISGGADSVCLLFVLLQLSKELAFKVHVVHVNHGIRAEAGEDAAYVQTLCRQYDLPFTLVEADVRTRADREKRSEEETGRLVRYEAFEKVCAQVGGTKIAVAHNANDQAETMLFHLFRGSGLTGLCGIRPVREQIIRPLLCVERGEIEDFLQQKGMSYCIDKTNEEDTYTRNRIRHHILPYAREWVSEGAISHMTNTAQLLQETEDFVKQVTQVAYDKCVTSVGRETDQGLQLQIPEALTYPPLIRKYLILSVLEECIPARKDVTARHVNAVVSFLENPGNRCLSLPGGFVARREYDRLIVERDPVGQELPGQAWTIDPADTGEIGIPGLGALEFQVFDRKFLEDIPQNQYTKWFDYDKIKESLTLRTRKEGDYLTIDRGLSRKSLQDYMVNEKIPRQVRDQVWLLADGQHILWVIGYRISQAYKVSEETKRILQVQLRGGHEDGGAH